MVYTEGECAVDQKTADNGLDQYVSWVSGLVLQHRYWLQSIRFSRSRKGRMEKAYQSARVAQTSDQWCLFVSLAIVIMAVVPLAVILLIACRWSNRTFAAAKAIVKVRKTALAAAATVSKTRALKDSFHGRDLSGDSDQDTPERTHNSHEVLTEGVKDDHGEGLFGRVPGWVSLSMIQESKLCSSKKKIDAEDKPKDTKNYPRSVLTKFNDSYKEVVAM